MVKKILFAAYIILATSLTVHGADKWTGPTSSLDPMWGLTGSSIMIEALRPKPVEIYNSPQDYHTSTQRRALEDAYEKGKADGQRSSSSYYNWRD